MCNQDRLRRLKIFRILALFVISKYYCLRAVCGIDLLHSELYGFYGSGGGVLVTIKAI